MSSCCRPWRLSSASSSSPSSRAFLSVRAPPGRARARIGRIGQRDTRRARIAAGRGAAAAGMGAPVAEEAAVSAAAGGDRLGLELLLLAELRVVEPAIDAARAHQGVVRATLGDAPAV